MAIGALNVITSNLLPREHYADEIKPIMPHPLVQWILRVLGKPIWPVCFVRGKKMERDCAFMFGNQLILPPSMWTAVRKAVPDWIQTGPQESLMRRFTDVA